FNDIGDASELRTLDLTLMGGTEIDGNLDLTNTAGTDQNLIPQRFQTLTINSEGTAENLLNGETANVITGNITATPTSTPDVDPSEENNLKNVVINASQDFVLEGDLVFSSVSDDTRFEATNDDAATVTLEINGDADVSIQQIDVTDPDIDTLVINNAGSGTLTVTGASPAINGDGGELETLTLEGTGDIVFGTDGEGITSATVSTIDASALSGDLTLGEVTDVDSADFAFTAGSGVTTMTLTTDELNADVNADPAESGWSIDYTNAAAGSGLRLGEDLDFTAGPLSINMGTNGTLYIDADTDLTALDLTLLGDQPIVVADGVELTLTAAQASGLNIIGENGVDSTGVVTITELGEEPVDLSGIQTELAGNVTLAEDSVALDAATDLGNFTVLLDGATAQLIGFATEEQADGQAVEATGTGEHSIAWLFNALVNKPLDASNYDGDITRLYINDQLVVSDPDIESYYEGLSQLIEIINIQFTGDLDDLLETIALQRTFEVQAYADLENGLALVDGDDQRFLENIDIEMGGQVTIGDISLDNIIGTDVEGDDSFGTLTISSELFDFDAPHGPGNALAPQEWAGDGSQVTPDAINTIGNISSGTERNDLRTVVLKTGGLIDAAGGDSGAALDIQTITFAGDDTVDTSGDTVDTATLELQGDNDITVKSIDAGGLDFELDTSSFSGTYTLTGGSPALIGTSHIDIFDNSGLVIDPGGIEGEGGGPLQPFPINENLAVINLGVDSAISDALTANPGIVAPTLETLDATFFAGELNVHLSEVAQSFVFTSGQGQTTVVLNGENLALETGGSWTFNMSSFGQGQGEGEGLGEVSQLVFTEAVALNGGSLTLNLGSNTVLIAGQTTFANLDELTITGGTLEVAAGASITLTAEQADNLDITGEGEVFITELGDEPVDLSGIQNTGGGTVTLADAAAITLAAETVLTGALELQIGETDLTLSADQMMVQNPEAQTVGLTITGATGNVDVTNYTGALIDLANVQADIAGDLILSGNASTNTTSVNFGAFTVDIGEYQLYSIASQLDGVTVKGVGPAIGGMIGNVFVDDLENTPNADLRNILTGEGSVGTVNAFIEGSGTVNEFTLNALDLGIANIVVSAATVNVEGTFIDYDRDADTATPAETASFTVFGGGTLELTAEQANDRTVDGSGTLNIGDLGQGPADIDLSNIALSVVAFAAVATDITLESGADLGNGINFNVAEDATLTLNSRQADEQRIVGEGRVLIDTVGQQLRSVQITEADSNAGQQSITINYTLNGVAGAVTVNNSVTNFTDVDAILAAFKQAFSGIEGIEAAEDEFDNIGQFDNIGLVNLVLGANAELPFTVDSVDVVNGGSTLAAEESGNLLLSDNTLETVETAEQTVTFDQNVLFQGNLGGSTEQVLTLDGEGRFILFGAFSTQPAELILVASAELYMDASANVSGLNASGDGVLRLADLGAAQAAINLSNIGVDTVLELEQAVNFTGNFNTTAQVTVEGDFELDISDLGDATDTVPANLPGSFVVAEGAAVRMTQAQGNELAASGEGDVVIELSEFGNDPDVDNNADFSNITADTELALSADVVFGGSIGAANVLVSGNFELTLFSTASFDAVETITVAAGATLQLSAAQANGLTIDGAGSVIVTDLDATPAANLSGITAATTLLLEADATLDAAGRLPTAAVIVESVDGEYTLDASAATNFDATSVEVGTDATLVVTDEQADALAITGDGDVTVEIDGGSSADLSGVAATLTIALSANSVFTGVFAPAAAEVAVTGDFEFDITAVDVTDLPVGFELSGTDLVITAAQGDELAVTGGSSVRVTDLAAALAALDGGAVNFSGITVSDELPGVIEINEDTTVGEGELNLDNATFTFVDGELVGYEGFTFEVAENVELDIVDFANLFGGTVTFIENGTSRIPNAAEINNLFGTDAALEALFGDSLGTVTTGQAFEADTPVWTDGAPAPEPAFEAAALRFTEIALNEQYDVGSGAFDLRIDFDQDLADGTTNELGAGFTVTIDDGVGGEDPIVINTGILGRINTGDSSRLELSLSDSLVITSINDGFANAEYDIAYGGTSFTVSDLNDLQITVEYDAQSGNLEGATGRVVADIDPQDVELTGIPASFYTDPVLAP
ncbi:MAG: hypothetical protein COA87_019245, partial [Halomonas sp.]|nr:hypothetical protein [Halomonas sp.]